ncbi:FAD-dependent oxidoreductase [Anaerosalibacter bizertensis]|uniref:FAD-dependent oxidoreductase n=1 Tax=Anaerosalibacter bizertensis TaxID=932217 RepID=A0A844FG16_9FIRM|nr:FAD-dependent oxidoreductase [Anaerosalibacter bizertensis]MBV1817421.1 FAD-dependent oxidoreductase [Bacteroidales bacterium MSK.15.36]MCB5558501.1 FAD-dependent oxidoreductase [Anaerosalibacter bizertensis]MCG4564265.1 FAD-dependent oxidoreductase [Anaerosalibacter bizertensis]MCG4581696.1 FAD-dependent oxidoreductase [Anaerosalibacter bizertensis]MCG4585161.1 FAD-dependent oxidoreductase [Anaerosalibacter bizertensis]
MDTVVIIGGGWAGCAASISARKAGAKVVLIERTDMLLGLGNVGGIMRNNGRFTATEENIYLGANELFEITDKLSRHKNIEFPGHKHGSLYDVTKVEPEVKKLLDSLDIEVITRKRVVDVIMDKNTIKSIVLDDESIIDGDAFIDTTGSTGPMGNCLKYGNGCSMCILRCPTFGPRISISQKAGVKDLIGKKSDGSYGAFSGSCKLNKDSLSENIRKELNEKGVVIVPVPIEKIDMSKLSKKVCQQYALKEYAENLILLDTGHAKLMTSFYPLEDLRKIKGFENARYEDPYSGGVGNSVRYLSMAPRDNTMKVIGVDNLFCGGEKSGLFVGHTEAISTGSLAGHNSVRFIKENKLLEIPRNIAIGDIIAYANEMIKDKKGLMKRYTFAGDNYFERMKRLSLYTTDKEIIRKRIEDSGLLNIYDRSFI